MRIARGIPTGISPQAEDKLTPKALTESAPSDRFSTAARIEMRVDSIAEESLKSIEMTSTDTRSERA